MGSHGCRLLNLIPEIVTLVLTGRSPGSSPWSIPEHAPSQVLGLSGRPQPLVSETLPEGEGVTHSSGYCAGFAPASLTSPVL